METNRTSLFRKPSRSTTIAGGLVLAAAAVAWFGMGAAGTSGGGPHEPVTAAGDTRPARAVEAVAGISMGGLPTRIVVPSAGVDASIAEVGVVRNNGRTAYETAWNAAGHHLDSALPGQAGNMVITGHVSVADAGNTAVFNHLDSVKAGDIVEVYSGDQAFRYEVSKVMVVPPTAVKLLRSDSTAQVTLVTCTKDLKDRLVVIGTLTT
jgi:LPXTG-site transpeptidase (sortase) family protein